MNRALITVGVACAVVVAIAPAANAAGGAAKAAAAASGVPTFTKDVAPILFKSCASCHRPGEVAPMSLLSYADARPWALVGTGNVCAPTAPARRSRSSILWNSTRSWSACWSTSTISSRPSSTR